MYEQFRETRNKSSSQNSLTMDDHTLVDVEWLKANLTSGVKVIDSTWHMPQTARVAREEYLQAHIQGAVFFDLDECRDKDAKYGEQILPSSKQFSQYIGQLGINNNDHVVLYDNNEAKGMFSAPRVWYMLRVFGHEKISILNGGLPAWKHQAGEVTTEVPRVEPVHYEVKYQGHLVKTYQDVLSNLETKEMEYIDARPIGRFEGKSPEPIPGVKPGHIPNTVNVPFLDFLSAEEPKVMRSVEEVSEIFRKAGVDLDKPCMFSCGTGLTACIALLGAYMCGHREIPLYDGAWAEWYHRADPQHMLDVPQD